jgi:hypothetical protein
VRQLPLRQAAWWHSRFRAVVAQTLRGKGHPKGGHRSAATEGLPSLSAPGLDGGDGAGPGGGGFGRVRTRRRTP